MTNSTTSIAKPVLFLLTVAMTMLATLTAFAQAPEMERKGKHGGECRTEIEAICGESGSKKDKRVCVESNIGNFSSVCQERIKKHAQKRAKLKAACESDVQTYCSGVKGKHDVFQCLKENKDSLSSTCSETLAKGHKRHRGKKGGKEGRVRLKAVCEADVQSYCADAGDKREIFQCLNAHQSNLSSECAAGVEKIKAHKARKASK